ncbi:MAG TPA: cupin-like domain-containing protein [Phaeodactylibacter sp.]|nr:cupin-like domain-containing protein [Phaeodactylibacter sp.]
MKLNPIERVSSLTRKEFEEEYLKKNKPVVFTKLAAEWQATNKWSFQWFRQNYGHIQVPVYDNSFRKAGSKYLCEKTFMPFGDFLNIIEHQETDLRMFLFNIFKEIPELVNDFSTPTITNGFLERFPMMFFGGKGAKVDLHYDLDCATVFITQFQGRKKIILFAPNQSKYLYQHPFTVQSEVPLDQVDYNKYPALKLAHGFETTIDHGETLFMPHLFWHFIYYTDGGFSLSLRRHNMYTRARGAFNIARHFAIDKGMNLLLGEKWRAFKAYTARKKAQSAITHSTTS